MNNYIMTMRAVDGSVVKLECHDSLPSTLRLARQYAKNSRDYPDRYVIFSEERRTVTEKGKTIVERGIFMSLILRPSMFPSQAGLLSSLAAVAFATGLEEHTTRKIGIGWVSDIFCGEKLIGKASIEGKLDDFTAYEYLIVTFAATLSEEDFPPRMTDLVRQVFEPENTSISLIIAKHILNNFFSFYPNFRYHKKFMDIYQRKFALRAEKIKYLDGDRRESCKVLGVDADNCSLIVENRKKAIMHIASPNKVITPKKLNKKNYLSQKS